MKTFGVKACLSVLLFGMLAGVASAHPQFMKALKDKYNFRTVSCFTCHMKGKDPATDKPYGKEVRNEFGNLFLPELKGKKVDDRALQSAELKREEKAEEAAVIDESLAKDFLEALGKVEAMKNGAGKTYGEMLKEGSVEGVTLPE